MYRTEDNGAVWNKDTIVGENETSVRLRKSDQIAPELWLIEEFDIGD